MSIQSLEKYLPQNTLQYLKIWFADYYIHIKITRNRNSKLGDYRKLPDHSHEITINSTLVPQLFSLYSLMSWHILSHLKNTEEGSLHTEMNGKKPSGRCCCKAWMCMKKN
ncbi:hypothetical protein [Chryseobacterium wanjuense]